MESNEAPAAQITRTAPRSTRRLAAVIVATIALTAVAGVAGATSSEAAAGTTRIVVTATTARAKPAASATGTKRLAKLDRVLVTQRKAGWAKTNKGWVPAKSLSVANHYADALAAKHGLRVQYTNNQACGPRASVNTATAFQAGGCYVAGNGYIQLTRSAAYDGNAAWKRNAVRDLVLHEVTHAKIYRITGTTHPKVAGNRVENVTDAYAWKYLGTSRAAGGYGFTSNDLAKAAKVHATGR